MIEPKDSILHKGKRKYLVDHIHAKGITDKKVLNALNTVPRHLFMNKSFIHFSYKDQAYPISASQTISQPFTVAFQSSLLQIEKGSRTLEIGTGSGYQAAVLCELGAQVYSIERQEELFIETQDLLKSLRYQAKLFFNDGNNGLPLLAPFDRILVTCAAPSIPSVLKTQLKIGGIMVVPVGDDKQQTMTVVTRLSEKKFKISKHGTFAFVPMLPGIEKTK